jgi:hypothetical protein
MVFFVGAESVKGVEITYVYVLSMGTLHYLAGVCINYNNRHV